MEGLNEIFPYFNLSMALVSTIFAVTLTILIKEIVGKKWLLASVVINLITWPGFLIISILTQFTEDRYSLYQWYDVLNMFVLFGTACFGLFLFINWSATRIKLDLMDFLFSFKGRIPRSAFWISYCIMYPLGLILGFAPFTTDAVGLAKIIIWIVYGLWSIMSIWISLAVYTKRWHDINKSGLMTLIILIPLVGFIYFIVKLGFTKGTPDANSYGENPLLGIKLE
ncbi:MAG TPA: DUF805 domain-containing protein [Melioribacteraceae bacterium]|nr:DUF805 domain-containing protein [Melioribacteraceae bacterium]